MKKLTVSILVFLSMAGTLPVSGKIILPALISDNMVLQQNADVTLWGWASDGAEKLKIWGTWGNDTVKTEAKVGKWSATIHTPGAGGPYSVFIQGEELTEIKNVLIGEVWVCSGQSNMQMPVDSMSRGFSGVLNFRQKIREANHPSIRFFQVFRRVSDHPQDDCIGKWVVCTPETVKAFSATGYFFSKYLNDSLHIPVGMIHTSWGGTPAETWLPEEVVMSNPEYAAGIEKLYKQNWWPIRPGQAYNAMIYPLLKYRIAGAIWYQGESNSDNPHVYRKLFPDLIKTWRKLWGIDFPFYYVQIAPYNYKNGLGATLVREDQLLALSVPKTGMAVTNDIGNVDNIHPRDKEEVGRRLALWALAKTYGKTGIVFSGPLYKSMKVDKNKIEISFEYVDGGLVKKGKTLTCFQIAGADHNFVDAKAAIKGDKVIVYNKKVKTPVAVRFAFSNTAEPNLFNAAGLPASAFRTDDWPVK